MGIVMIGEGEVPVAHRRLSADPAGNRDRRGRRGVLAGREAPARTRVGRGMLPMQPVRPGAVEAWGDAILTVTTRLTTLRDGFSSERPHLTVMCVTS